MQRRMFAIALVLIASLLPLACAVPEDERAPREPQASTSEAQAPQPEPAPPAESPAPLSAPEPAQTAVPPPVAATPPQPSPEVAHMVGTARELREERTYVVRLHSQKHQISLSLWKHMKNAMTAVEHDVVVGESTYNDWYVGKELSDQFDSVGVLAHGEWANYVTEVKEKWILTDHFVIARDGTQTEIDEGAYQEALRLLGEKGAILTVPYSNVTSTYILDRPLAEYEFVKREPLTRYFVTVRIQNSSLTLSLTKALRNATTAAEISFEVPKAIYDSSSEVWDPTLSGASAVLKGRLSTLHGTIIKRWSAPDPKYQVATAADGETFIIPTPTT